MSGPRSPSDGRAAVERWLSEQPGLGGPGWRAEPPIGDVSTRKYYRARAQDRVPPARRARARVPLTLVVARYPPDERSAYDRFVTSTRLLQQARVRTPRILACDPERRFMALEDVGTVRLFDLDPRSTRAERLFDEAAALAPRIAALDPAPVAALNPPLDAALFERELEQTWRLFLGARLAPALGERLRAGLARLCRSLELEPSAPCHRDFMARNLMVSTAGGSDELVVIDHQDLRLGPRGYDLASLLYDSCRLAEETRARLEQRYRAPGDHLAHHRLVVQRMLKIVGTFHAFAHRGDPQHLPMVAGALERALEHAAELPELADLVPELRRLPAAG